MILTKADLLHSYIVGAMTGFDVRDRERIANEVMTALRKEGHWPELDDPTRAHAGHGHATK